MTSLSNEYPVTPQTKQQAVKKLLMEMISQGNVAVGDPLPSREHLANRLGMSVAPVRQALAELVEEGLIASPPGRRGYFVADSQYAGRNNKQHAVAMVYEGARYHPELSDGKLFPQLLVDEINRLATERNINARSIPHAPVLGEGEDEDLLEILSRQKVVIYLNHCYRHWTRLLESRGCFVLEVNRPVLPGYNWVGWDREQAYLALMDHLLELGHRRIGYLGLYSTSDYAMPERFLCYCRRMRERGLPLNNDHIEWFYKHSPLSGYRGARRMLDRLGRERMPSALVVDSDIRAIQAMAAFREAGLRVPEDISVVGIENRPEAEACEPPLTTVGPDWKRTAEVVLGIAERVLRDQPVPARISQIVPFQLKTRQSSAPPRPQATAG